MKKQIQKVNVEFTKKQKKQNGLIRKTPSRHNPTVSHHSEYL